MKITFKEHTFTVRKNEEGLFALTDIENGWKESGGKGKALKDWKRSPIFKELDQFTEFHTFDKRDGKEKKNIGGKCLTVDQAIKMRMLLESGDYVFMLDNLHQIRDISFDYSMKRLVITYKVKCGYERVFTNKVRVARISSFVKNEEPIEYTLRVLSQE